MDNVIDTRGLSCPQPVMMTMDGINAMKQGNAIILVDTDTVKENVVGVAKRLGCQVTEVQPDGVGYKITITKS